MIECLTVVTAIAILFSLLLPSLSLARRKAAARAVWTELWQNVRCKAAVKFELPQVIYESYFVTGPEAGLKKMYGGTVTFANASWDMIYEWRRTVEQQKKEAW